MSREGYRHELKFICSEAEMQLIEDRIRHICTRDMHAGPDGIYHIRSLYFDTYNDACLQENEAGVDNRHKYRIRTYNDSADVIRLERKGSMHGLKRKETCLLTKQQCDRILEGLPVEDMGPEQEVLQEFLVERQMRLLQPKVIVEYERAPYVYPIGNVRITFDRDITSSDSRDFFEADIPKRCIMPLGKQILEVKYDDILPHPILELVSSSFDLQKTAFSKYALCREYRIR